MDALLNDFSPGLFVMMTVLFLVLVFLMVRFAWKPIIASLEAREEGIRKALESAEDAKKEMQNINADNERLLQEARETRDKLVKEGREMKEKFLSEAKDEAQSEGERLIQKAQETIEAEKKAAIAEIKTHIADLTVAAAERVLRDELSDDKKQEKYIDGVLGDIKLN